MKRFLFLAAALVSSLAIGTSAQADGLSISYGGVNFSQSGQHRNLNYRNQLSHGNQNYYRNRGHNNWSYGNQHFSNSRTHSNSNYGNYGWSNNNIGHSNFRNNSYRPHVSTSKYVPVHNNSFNQGFYSH